MAREVTIRGIFAAHQPDDDDLRKAAALPLNACPRRYCWWWRSLAFEWDIEPTDGCQFLCSKKPRGWKNVDRPCTRSGRTEGVDHYEPREPHLMEDGFDARRFVAPRSGVSDS